MSAVHAVVLAAGKGTRMKSDHAKVLHEAAGRTMLDWVLEAVSSIEPDRTLVVVGHQADEVGASLPDGCEAVLQEPQAGTGHAVEVALRHLGPVEPGDTVVVAYGDMPMVPGSLYAEMSERAPDTAATIVTVDPGPDAFGRIVRDAQGRVTAIVEQRDCDAEQLAITERNVGLYAFASGSLAEAIGGLTTDNDQGELYLTDVISYLTDRGENVASIAADPAVVTGVNSHADLAQVQAMLRDRINHRLMEDGVWMLDPDSTYVEAGVVVEPGARLYPGTHLEGASSVGAGATVGPNTLVRDSEIAADATVMYSVLREARVGIGAVVGPYASLRPGTVLEAGSKAGTFVETKNTTVGEGAKVPHLAYMGDAVIGRRVNVGAGTITCNYDGYVKSRTVIDDGAFIGSDTMLVAPVTIGAGAVTGAGSVITEDVAPGALAVERSQQREVPGYAEKRAARQRAKDADEST